MNGGWLFWRLTMGLILGAVIAAVLPWRNDGSLFTLSGKEKPRYTPYFPYWLLPLYLLLELFLFPVIWGLGRGDILLGVLFQVAFQLAVYDGLMLLLLPLLRRFIRPQTCVFLWMLPNYLYLTQQVLTYPPRPLAVIAVPGQVMLTGCLIWGVGFLMVMGWKILSHLRFRRRILKSARPMSEPDTVKLWDELLQWAGMAKKRYPLLVSSQVTSPLSIGLFSSTIRVVLPERTYTREELALILRHELIHIGCGDSSAKFFLAFCSALCWFNPLVWAAMGKGAEELELNCDQGVLEWSGEEERETYARLLLRTAGEQAGFTTCLSTSAASLRYRLRQILHPACRNIRSGVAALAIFALIMSSGLVYLAYGVGTLREVLSSKGGWEISQISEIYRFHNGKNGSRCRAADQDALLNYLEGLRLQAVTGLTIYKSDGEELWLDCALDENSTFRLTLQDNMAYIYPVNRASNPTSYLVGGGVDWAYLESLLIQETPNDQ